MKEKERESYKKAILYIYIHEICITLGQNLRKVVHNRSIRASRDGNIIYTYTHAHAHVHMSISLALRVSTSTSSRKTSHRNNTRRIMSAWRLKREIARITHDHNSCAELVKFQ